MKRTVLRSGEPVRNLQHFLRLISYYYNTVPAVIPDGIFSDQTRESVMGFQRTFNLPINGIVDYETWNAIIVVYKKISNYEEDPWTPQIFPSNNFSINPNDKSTHLYTVQAMLYALTLAFNNIGTLNINGTHDDQSTSVVKALQKLFDLDTTGIIDKTTYNMIVALYSTFITNNELIPME